jgi:hypothetical protein
MYIANESIFEAFLQKNAAFWAAHGAAATRRDAIFVDLAHDNSAYLLTNLWIAKYLQRRSGASIVGLTATWPIALPHYDEERIRRLAASFLVDEVIRLDQPTFDDEALVERFRGAVDGLSGHALREAILAFGADVDPDLGWVLYDTWIRGHRIATIEAASDELIECARDVVRCRNGVAAAMRQRPVEASVVGHYHYNPYAWMAREAVAQDAPAYFQSVLLPVSIRRFSSVADFRRGVPADFAERYQKDVVARVDEVQLATFRDRMFDIQGGTRQFFRIQAQGAGGMAREAFLSDLGLLPEAPTVCVYVPALCGPPHCFGPIMFDDNADWLASTLMLAKELPDINFLVKAHPQDSTYDTSGFMAKCEAAYGEVRNIKFVESGTPLGDLASMIDLAITVSGTPGYELAARGVRTLAAGPSRYSGLGFSLEASSAGEYASYLKHVDRTSLDANAVRAALNFMFFEMTAGRSTSAYLPSPRLVDSDELWEETGRRILSALPEEDPLWRNLMHMIDADVPFLLNTDVVPPLATQPTPRTASDVALAGLHAMAVDSRRNLEAALRSAQVDIRARDARIAQLLQFVSGILTPGHRLPVGRGQFATAFLRDGWSSAEPGGVWSEGHFARIDLPPLPSGTTVVLEGSVYTRPDSMQRHFVVHVVGGVAVERTVGAGEMAEISVVVGEASGVTTSVVVHTINPEIPPGDGRRLGFCLTGIRIEGAIPFIPQVNETEELALQ